MPTTNALWCLRLCVAVQCLSAARNAWEGVDAIHEWLFEKAGLLEAANLTGQIAAVLLMIVAVSAILKPQRWLLALCCLWMFAIAFATKDNPGSESDTLALLAHAVRIALPIGLALLLPKSKKRIFGADAPPPIATWLLVLGCSATFAAHGIEAVRHNPEFTMLIFGSADWINWEPSQANVETILTVIGVHDFILVALLLLRRWRWVAGWMAFWGFTTALSRMTAMGDDVWYETFIRVANGGVPLALFLAWWQLVSPNAHRRHS